MTLREEIAQGENVALEFKGEAEGLLKYLKAVVAFSNGRIWHTVSDTLCQFE